MLCRIYISEGRIYMREKKVGSKKCRRELKLKVSPPIYSMQSCVGEKKHYNFLLIKNNFDSSIFPTHNGKYCKPTFQVS